MQCPACTAENPAEHRFCDTCGAALVRCPGCGALGRPGAHFCGQCGAALAEQEPGPPAARDDTLPRRDAQRPLATDALPTGGPSPFLGRDGELAALIDRFERAKAGRGQLVCLAGSAGIGKSRLVRELRHEMSLRGEAATWLEARCTS